MMKLKGFLIFAIICIAFFLRFNQLGINPPSLTWDEVAWGYNAYSIGIDGKDEFGRFLPINYLESFGDFKPPLYAYLDVIPIKIFGLNEFAVRFPSAFFGVLTVLFSYFLVREIFYKSKIRDETALFSSFLLAISPWHIMLSRAAFEANIGAFLTVLGIFSFIYGVRKKKLFIFISIISFALSFYTFNTSRVISPILLITLLIGFRKFLVVNKKIAILSILFFALLLLPIAGFLISPQASLRFKEVNIFSDIGVIENANQQIVNDNNSFVSKLIHNRRLAFGAQYLKHYFDNLSPDFLFIKGDGNPKFSTQNIGQLYLWELPFLIAGILFLIKRKEGYWWLIPLWLLIGIIPAGTARETPHALRIENSLPTFQILISYGVITVLGIISKIKYKIAKIHIKYLIFPLFILFLIFNFLYFFHDYLMHYPRIYSEQWQYGYRDSASFVKEVYEDYDLIYITKELGRPYIYYLFHAAKNPEEFRKSAIIKRDAFGFVEVEGYDKLRFIKEINPNRNEKNLYIDLSSEVPRSANILKNFYLLNGFPILRAYTL